MNKQPLLLSLLLAASMLARGQELVLEGIYCGRNLYIQNPLADTGFCMQKVLVNGNEVAFKSAAAAEIKLDTLGLKDGDEIAIRILHKKDCKPKVLNPEPCPSRYIEYVSIGIDSTGTLKWKTRRETARLPFIIERFQWNKWVKLGEVDGKGDVKENEYSFTIKPHSGKNLVRVKQVNLSGIPRISKTVELVSDAPEAAVEKHSIDKEIRLTAETMYELYDNEGNIVRKGFGKTIDTSGLPSGHYYLNFDNKLTEVTKY